MADLWSWNNWIDESGVAQTANGAATGFPVVNLFDPRPGRIWRAPALGGEVTFTLAGAHPVTVLGAFGGDMRTGNRFTVSLGDNVSTFNLFDQTITPAIDPITRHWVIRTTDLGLSDTVTVRMVRIAMLDNYELGRIWVGGADWVPRVGHVYGSEWSAIDYGRRQVVPFSGAIIAQTAAKRRVFRPRYDAITWDEGENEIRNLDLIAGTTRQVLFVPSDDIYPREKFALLGYLDEISPVVAAGWERNERQFSLVEGG